jgi:hypothetical protein
MRLCVHCGNIAYIAFAVALASPAQSVMGTVSTHDANVTGGLEVQAQRASLLSNASITAFDHTAPITLTRGGDVLVCSTSQFHLLHAGTEKSLLFGLDRGALELHTATDAHDVILTPDIRFTVESPGMYDLRIRVTANGDTCVDNAGTTSPTLVLADAFSASSYRLIPGQHVLFEHGNLREVVDHERSACGCPSEKPSTALTPAEQANPFPAAASAGLAPITPPSNSSPDGQVHAQVNATLIYGQTDVTATPPATTTYSGSAAPPPTPPGAHDIAHAIGHFFHKLFHPSDKPAKPAQ